MKHAIALVFVAVLGSACAGGTSPVASAHDAAGGSTAPAEAHLRPASGQVGYIDTPTRYAEVPGRRLAYRSVGSGTPLILCNRFRGILDSWDPAFIDALARDHTVITFDYSGLGLSTGQAPSSIVSMSDDVKDLAQALGYSKIALGGWSLGGLAAQAALVRFPQLISHLVLIGTGPAGENEHGVEPIFLERAHKPVNDLDDEVILFFEPASEASRNAAKASHDRIAARRADLSVPVPPAAWPGLHAAGAESRADKLGVREALKRTQTPILVISGDHDIVFPVENWYVLNRQLPTATLVTFPRAGHGPQHEYIEASAVNITAFLRTTR